MPLFGTPPASGNYNANTDPRLQYANPLTGASAANPLAQQLQIVARMIDAPATPASAAKRQVFFVSIGGFDTHDAQNRTQADLMARLAHGAGVLRRHARQSMGAPQPGHHVHRQRLRPHLHQQRRRHRPRLGQRTTS